MAQIADQDSEEEKSFWRRLEDDSPYRKLDDLPTSNSMPELRAHAPHALLQAREGLARAYRAALNHEASELLLSGRTFSYILETANYLLNNVILFVPRRQQEACKEALSTVMETMLASRNLITGHGRLPSTTTEYLSQLQTLLVSCAHAMGEAETYLAPDLQHRLDLLGLTKQSTSILLAVQQLAESRAHLQRVFIPLTQRAATILANDQADCWGKRVAPHLPPREYALNALQQAGFHPEDALVEGYRLTTLLAMEAVGQSKETLHDARDKLKEGYRLLTGEYSGEFRAAPSPANYVLKLRNLLEDSAALLENAISPFTPEHIDAGLDPAWTRARLEELQSYRQQLTTQWIPATEQALRTLSQPAPFRML